MPQKRFALAIGRLIFFLGHLLDALRRSAAAMLVVTGRRRGFGLE